MADLQVNKNTNDDKRSILSKAVQTAYGHRDYYCWTWLQDFDDQYVYFQLESDKGCANYRDTYEYSGTKATVGGNPEEVVRLTEYKTVEQDTEKSLEGKIVKALKKVLGSTFGETKGQGHQVIKQFEEEEMVAVEPLYVAAEGVDGVGDTISLEDTYAMVESLNTCLEKGLVKDNFFHKVQGTGAFTILKAWVNECDCMIGDTFVPEGQPIAKVKFNNKDAWELRKSGELCGLSIGAKAKEIEELE